MQGYDLEAAVPYIAAKMRKEGIKAQAEELNSFIRRAILADFAFMQENEVLTEDGLMGVGEYDEDDAFESILDMLCGEEEDDAVIDRVAQWLDAYMTAQAAFMEECGLVE
ncbi:MAG: hypothetical protein IKU34_11685 [Clostridia bacterium]|nr:hypothetical protein [Clostridia bacterium]